MNTKLSWLYLESGALSMRLCGCKAKRMEQFVAIAEEKEFVEFAVCERFALLVYRSILLPLFPFFGHIKLKLYVFRNENRETQKIIMREWDPGRDCGVLAFTTLSTCTILYAMEKVALKQTNCKWCCMYTLYNRSAECSLIDGIPPAIARWIGVHKYKRNFDFEITTPRKS